MAIVKVSTKPSGDHVLFDQVRAARHVEGCVDAVDLNLGCPQKIAKKGNYGAFLLPKPGLCEQIISTMSR